MKKLYIVGAGSFGREVLWLVQRINEHIPTWDFVGFIDDNNQSHGEIVSGFPVVGGCDCFQSIHSEIWVAIAVGSPQAKKKLVDKLTAYQNIRFATLIDPTVLASKSVTVGEGSILCAGAILTVDIRIGKYVLINLDCTIGHDVVIEDYSTVYPGVNVSGNVIIGQETEVGTGSQIVQGKRIGDHIVVGAGSVVTKDILEPGTYVGAPVRKVK